MTQAVDLLIDGGILFDVGIRVSDIGLRLIIVVVGNEILHRVIREKLPKLRTKLGSKGLVMGQHQCGAV